MATPIGNLDDLSPRAQSVLAKVSLIAAEDTRHTGRLLSRIGVKTPTISYHDHNESARVEGLLQRLIQGEDIALVTDAGTPLVSDPGYRLVVAARRAGVIVCPIPGPSAVTAALSVAGLPTDRWSFEGFLPRKAGEQRARLNAVARDPRTLVFFESVHRLPATLEEMATAFGGDRSAFIARELTKLHEQAQAGTLSELAALADNGAFAKGELVVIVAGAVSQTSADAQELQRIYDVSQC